MTVLKGDKYDITASLLHDIGHVLKEPISPDTGKDDYHEYVGYKFLHDLGFPDEVKLPILAHVKAKRYFATIDPRYYKNLSDGSRLSFHLQGGFLTRQEISTFVKSSVFDRALRVRISDDRGKSTYQTLTPPLEHYRNIVLSTLKNTLKK